MGVLEEAAIDLAGDFSDALERAGDLVGVRARPGDFRGVLGNVSINIINAC
jgi:hypothetical protein